MVDQLRIRQFFEQILSFDDVKKPKPDPEMIIALCKALKVSPKDSLLVGVSKEDILMGKKAGIKTALYTPEENKKFYNFEILVKEADPDVIIKTLAEVKELVI